MPSHREYEDVNMTDIEPQDGLYDAAMNVSADSSTIATCPNYKPWQEMSAFVVMRLFANRYHIL